MKAEGSGETAGGVSARATRQGLLYAMAAYGLWGVVALYFKAIGQVPPLEILAHRVAWSALFLALLLTAWGRWGDVRRCLRLPAARWRLFASTIFIAVNWFVYIYSVVSNQLLQSSLGYFINPLVNVLLGRLVLGERLRPWQWAAVGLAAAGVLNLVARDDQFPWIALTLAFSFGAYGLLRKQVHADGLTGLSVETLLLLPAALGYLLYIAAAETITFGTAGARLDVLLALSGVVTAVPLLCFGQAARRLRLSTMGFLQYLSPTLQLVLAVAVFREAFGGVQLVSFACIWVALALYSFDSVWAYRRRPRRGGEREMGSESAVKPAAGCVKL